MLVFYLSFKLIFAFFCDWLLISVRSYCYSILHFIGLHCMCLQGGDGDSDLLSADQRPSVENARLRLQVSTRQEPGVRDSDGVCGPPCTLRRHRSLLRYCLLRDTSSHQDSASTRRPHVLYTLVSRLGLKIDMLKTPPQHVGLMQRTFWLQDSASR